MKRTRLKLISIALLTLIACKAPETKKELEVVGFEKLQEIMSAKDDQTVYIYNFWATWCAPCIAELPHFNKVANDLGKDVKLVMVSLNDEDEVEKVQKFLDTKNYQAEHYLLQQGDPNIWMPKVNKDWSGAIPITILKYGTKEFFHEGKMSEEQLRNEIQKIKE